MTSKPSSLQTSKVFNKPQKQETNQETYNMPAKLVDRMPVQTRKQTQDNPIPEKGKPLIPETPKGWSTGDEERTLEAKLERGARQWLSNETTQQRALREEHWYV